MNTFAQVIMLISLLLTLSIPAGIEAQPPALTNPTVDSAEPTSALLGATITSSGGSALVSRGTVWNTIGAPIIENPLAEGNTGTGEFTHIRENLPAGSLVYFRGYATNSAGTGYSPELSFYTEPETQPSGITFTSVTDTGLRMAWTPGDGDGTIVVMQEGTLVDADPVDGIQYRASAVLGKGDDLGNGNYIIAQGVQNSVVVTGLRPGSTYAVALYEYAGSGNGISGINYQQTEPTRAIRVTPLGSVIGKAFNITIYSPFTKANVSTLSFFDDGFLQFSAFRGFGIYTAAGNLFWGSYWTPNFEGSDLLIVFTGVTFGSYLSATGVSTINTNLNSSSLWFFLGHES